jgi:hypothetical protein
LHQREAVAVEVVSRLPVAAAEKIRAEITMRTRAFSTGASVIAGFGCQILLSSARRTQHTAAT